MDKYTLIRTYGEEILHSEMFSAACSQKHHLYSDVASHSINTALVCIGLWRILRIFRIRVNPAILIIAALTHDFGILGRKTKFRSGFQCLTRHPMDSVAILNLQNPQIDPRICQAVESHMFPLYRGLPQSTEAWLLTIADKCAAVTDWFTHYTVQQICS